MTYIPAVGAMIEEKNTSMVPDGCWGFVQMQSKSFPILGISTPRDIHNLPLHPELHGELGNNIPPFPPT